MVALLHSRPRHAPGRELTGRLRRRIDEHTHDLLIGAPVAAAHGIGKMHILIIAARLDGIGQARLHATRCGGRMRALRRHQRKNDGVVAAPLCGNGSAQASESAADDENVGVIDPHGLIPVGSDPRGIVSAVAEVSFCLSG